MANRSVWGAKEKLGNINKIGATEHVYDKDGKKLGTADDKATRTLDGTRVANERMAGVLFDRKKR